MDHGLKLSDPRRKEVDDLFTQFGARMLGLGFARPSLKEFFKTLHALKRKDAGVNVVMYTSAPRYGDVSEKEYTDWLLTLKNILEHYTGYAVYDFTHSGRTDEEHRREAADGATLKDVRVILKKLGITQDAVQSVVFLDDRPHNIASWEEHKFVRLGMKAYHCMPLRASLAKVCAEYDARFSALGCEVVPSQVLASEYAESRMEIREDNAGRTNARCLDADHLSPAELRSIRALFGRKTVVKPVAKTT